MIFTSKLVERVVEHVGEHAEAVADPAGRARQVDDQGIRVRRPVIARQQPDVVYLNVHSAGGVQLLDECHGVFGFPKAIRRQRAWIVICAQPRQRLAGLQDQIHQILITADEGVSQDELVARIAEVLPEGPEVITGEEATEQLSDQVQSGFSFVTTILSVFAGLALLKARLKDWQAEVASETFVADGVQLELRLPENRVAEAQARITDLSRGHSEARRLD